MLANWSSQLFDMSTGQCKGDMLTSAVTGQLVCVTINIVSRDDVRSLIVEVYQLYQIGYKRILGQGIEWPRTSG